MRHLFPTLLTLVPWKHGGSALSYIPTPVTNTIIPSSTTPAIN